MGLRSAILFVLLLLGAMVAGGATAAPVDSTSIKQVARIRGGLSPKSIVWNGHGLFFAQNMMYRHSVAVFDDNFQRCGTISDRVVLEDLGICDKPGSYRGAPVECVFTADGRHAYVSNYHMEGEGYNNPGCDNCHGAGHDGSFVYRINTATLQVEAVFPTGSVPKFLALTPDGRTLLVSNWSSGDVSVIDLEDPARSQRIAVGRFPRGLAVEPTGRYAYVALMGSTAIKRIDLLERTVEHFATVGVGPRHLCVDRSGTLLYASLNHEGSIARVELATRRVTKVHVGGSPRSMTFGADQQCLYVVDYSRARITKLAVEPFAVAATAATDSKPIGITYDARNRRIWVACYSGSVQVFQDEDGSDNPCVETSVATNPQRAPKPAPTMPAKAATLTTPSAPATGATRPAAPTPKPEPVPIPSGPPPTRGTYLVVAGGFRERANANKQLERLRALELQPFVQEASKPGGLDQVVAGAFGSLEEAQACQARMAASGFAAWVKRP